MFRETLKAKSDCLIVNEKLPHFPPELRVPQFELRNLCLDHEDRMLAKEAGFDLCKVGCAWLQLSLAPERSHPSKC